MQQHMADPGTADLDAIYARISSVIPQAEWQVHAPLVERELCGGNEELVPIVNEVHEKWIQHGAGHVVNKHGNIRLDLEVQPLREAVGVSA